MSKRSNEEWLSHLRAGGPARESALADLRSEMLYGLPFALRTWLSPDDPRFEALAEEVTQETLLRVLDHLDSFEGRSLFTTWVHKIAVRVALTELRRRRWRDVSLDQLMSAHNGEHSPQAVPDPGVPPETAVERSDAVVRLQAIMHEALTARQLQAMMAVGMKEMPLEEVARRMGMKRNALYKLLHDARVRLKRRLAHEGLTPAELLAGEAPRKNAPHGSI